MSLTSIEPTSGRSSSEAGHAVEQQRSDAGPSAQRMGHVLRSPGVPRALGATLLGRLPSSMAPVAVLLVVSGDGGGFARAGALAATQGLAAALGQPAWGRQVDRFGHRVVLSVSTVLASAAFVMLAVVGSRGTVASPMLVALSGLCSPPLQSSLRSRWGDLVGDSRALPSALALDSASAEVIYVGGPLLAVGCAALVAPAAALYLAAGVGVLGSGLVVRGLPRHVRRPSLCGDWVGPLRSWGLWVLVLVLGPVGVALGSVPVAGLVLSHRYHAGLLGGGVPAAFAFGSLVGGVGYAVRPWGGSASRQLAMALGGYLLCWSAYPAASSPALALGGAVLPGLFLAPALTTAFLHVDLLIAPDQRTEAHAILIGVIGAGEALGAVGAGLVFPAWWPVAGAAMAAAALFLGYRTLASAHHLGSGSLT